MSKGKYSPTVYRMDTSNTQYIYNAKGEIPPAYTNDEYQSELHFADYDAEGFDSYGYSGYDADGVFVGYGSGVDRNGITEDQYSAMSDDEFEKY